MEFKDITLEICSDGRMFFVTESPVRWIEASPQEVQKWHESRGVQYSKANYLQKPEMILGITFYPEALISQEELNWLQFATTSGKIHEDFSELKADLSGDEPWLPFELRICDSCGEYWASGERPSVAELMKGQEGSISYMVNNALKIFRNPKKTSADYWLAFKSWFEEIPTDSGTEYDSGFKFLGFVTGLKVSLPGEPKS